MLSLWHCFNVSLVFLLSYQLWVVDAFDQVIINNFFLLDFQLRLFGILWSIKVWTILFVGWLDLIQLKTIQSLNSIPKENMFTTTGHPRVLISIKKNI